MGRKRSLTGQLDDESWIAHYERRSERWGRNPLHREWELQVNGNGRRLLQQSRLRVKLSSEAQAGLPEWVRMKRPRLCRKKWRILHPDNGPPYSALAVRATPVPKHLSYSSVLGPCVPKIEQCAESNSFSVCRWSEFEDCGPTEQGVRWWFAAELWILGKQ